MTAFISTRSIADNFDYLRLLSGFITGFGQSLISSFLSPLDLIHNFLHGTRSHRRRPDRLSAAVSRPAEEAKAGKTSQSREAAAQTPYQELEAELGPAILDNI